MAKVMTVLRQPGILRYTASNSEDPREFDETIVLPNPNPNPSSAQASMKPTPFRMLSAVSFCPLIRPRGSPRAAPSNVRGCPGMAGCNRFSALDDLPEPAFGVVSRVLRVVLCGLGATAFD